MSLIEVKTKTEHYYVDGNGNIQGEYTQLWHENDEIYEHCFYENGELHGECKKWDWKGKMVIHTYYHKGKDLKVDPTTLSKEDLFYIELTGELP